MNEANLAVMLSNSLRAATDSLDLSRINAVHKIVEIEHTSGLEGLYRSIAERPVEFLMVAAPAFDKHLKRATGRDRDNWLSLLNKESDFHSQSVKGSDS